MSEHAGTLIIGNDPDEWWHGEEAHAVWGHQLEELGAFPVVAYEVEAWEEGTVGWASVKETIAPFRTRSSKGARATSSTSNRASGGSCTCIGRCHSRMSRSWRSR